MKLQIERLLFAYDGGGPVLRDIHLEALPGEVTVIIGPNASGKSTLLKCVAGMLKPRGAIRLDGKETSGFKKDEITQWVSYLPQEKSSRAVLTVFEAVLLGRIQSLSWRVGKEDLAPALEVLEGLGIERLASRFLDELSGGQKQMVSIAQALVRQSRVLLLDEPLSGLDLRHELEILDLLREITVQRRITTVIALHDLNLAARYADKVVILKDGDVFALGEPEAVLTSQTIGAVYGVNCKVAADDGVLQITPLSSIRSKFGNCSEGNNRKMDGTVGN
ncbi:MAG: ABC transporter ATP-binding protein [Thermodesulfobacteriota bacterium]